MEQFPAIQFTAARDGWRLSRNGQHENANERREDFVQRSNCPTQAKIGLEWATGLCKKKPRSSERGLWFFLTAER